MEVEVREIPLTEVDSDLLAVGLFDGGELPDPLGDAPGAADAQGGYRKTAMLYPGGTEAGAGGRARQAGGVRRRAGPGRRGAGRQARGIASGRARWPGRYPTPSDPEAIAGGAGRGRDPRLLSLRPLPQARRGRPAAAARAADDRSAPTRSPTAADAARIAAEAQNRARELQELPSNVATPSFLADRVVGDRRHAREAQLRGARPRGDRRQEDGRPGGGQPGQRRGAAADRPALRGRRRGADRPGRQGGDLRQRRDLDQAGDRRCTR